MNCNEEFVVKALGKLTLEFNYDWDEQKKIRELLHLSLYNYEVMSSEKSLVTSDLKEKILLYLQVKKLENYSKATLKNYIDTRKDENEALFIASKFPYKRIGKRGLELIISRIGERADIGKSVYPHLLRHTMATLGLQSGADITTIQHLLGHTTPSTTQIYAETSLDNLKHEYKQHFNC